MARRIHTNDLYQTSKTNNRRRWRQSDRCSYHEEEASIPRGGGDTRANLPWMPYMEAFLIRNRYELSLLFPRSHERRPLRPCYMQLPVDARSRSSRSPRTTCTDLQTHDDISAYLYLPSRNHDSIQNPLPTP
jgi:hypothetical protein